jgi:uncharacterized protein
LGDPPEPARIANLDLIRGIAVLGILTVNIAGFAGTSSSPLSPHLPFAGSHQDEWTFAAVFVLFEGKMRALFSLLFGASMLLFIDKAEARGRDGAMLQMRRLGWLTVLGYLHFALLWWGDILFAYGLLGLGALALREIETRRLAIAAVAFFILWHLIGMALTWKDLTRDVAVSLGQANAQQYLGHAQALALQLGKSARELALYSGPYPVQVGGQLASDWIQPLDIAISTLGETVPLMALGMVLHRTGFFAGTWPMRRLRRIAGWGIALGAALTIALLVPAWRQGFPVGTMFAYLLFWTAIPHLLMTLGYAALLVLLAPRLLATRLGRRIEAAGRMAFSNYIGTSLVMTAIFYGWGLGLVGTVGHAAQVPFVLLGWALMLGWSKPWLARFRQGPLEWLWRSLTEWRSMPFRR